MSGTNDTTGGLRRITRLTTPVHLRLIGLILAVALGMFLVVWIKTSTWRKLNRLQQEFAAMQTESFYFGNFLRGGVSRMNNALLRFQIFSDPAERESFHKEARELQERLTKDRAHLMTPAERAIARRAEIAFRHYLEGTAPLLAQGLPQISRDSCAQVQAQINDLSTPLIDMGIELVSVQQRVLSDVFAESRQTMRSLQFLIQLSLILLVVLVAATAGLMYRVLVKPLRAQLTATQAVMERQEKLASLGTLATGVAHEIRNPLTAIKFRLFSLRKSLPANVAEAEDIVVINNEINRLERIVKDFLQFARPTTPTLVKVSAQRLLEEVRTLLQPQLEKNGITMRLEAADNAWIKADPQQMQQVLINLVQNSAESIEGSGKIMLRAKAGMSRLNRQAMPTVTLEVSDTGKGIPLDVQPRIFDPFYSTKEGGTGLGLPIAARIVEKHGGIVQFQSQINRGTTFTIVLPSVTSDVNPDTVD